MENFKKTLEENNLIIHKDGQTVPINTTIAPTHFSYQQYKAVEQKQHIMNKLIYNIMKHDKDKIDDTFWDMLNKIKRCKPKKDIDGLFIRTDYLLDEDNIMKQVEINTISLAFKFFGPMLNRIHKLKCDETIVSDSDKEFINFVKEIKQDYEDDAVAIMVDNDTGMASSNYFEKSEIIRLLKVHGIGMYHLTFQDMIKTCQFRTRDGNEVEDSDVVKILKEGKMINSEYEMYYHDRKVFFIYYRWYYNESHYTPEDITMRSKLEFSSAFSLPSVELQMAGHKAYQIKYLHRSYLRKFLTDEEVESIFPHFGKFKNYEDLKNGDEENYILKSYKEGGGNNLFGEEIYKYKGNKKDVFLMKKICSKHSRNTFVNSGEEIEVIPEIGIMGWVIGRNGKIHHNKNAGYICRTKNIKSNECGVSCGFGALDSLTKNNE